jgi:hypothetical protein
MFTKEEIKQRIFKLRNEGKYLPANYNLACFIADAALIHETDKSGAAYAHHTSEVSRHNTDSETKMIIGKLHDVVEDSEWTCDDLRQVDFAERIVEAVDALTHRHGEPYFDSIERAAENKYAHDVKIKDLRHNLSGNRNNWMPTAKDLQRIQKYTVSYNYLVALKKGEIEAGTSVPDYMRGHDAFKNYVTAEFLSGLTSQPLPAAPQPKAPSIGGPR